MSWKKVRLITLFTYFLNAWFWPYCELFIHACFFFIPFLIFLNQNRLLSGDFWRHRSLTVDCKLAFRSISITPYTLYVNLINCMVFLLDKLVQCNSCSVCEKAAVTVLTRQEKQQRYFTLQSICVWLYLLYPIFLQCCSWLLNSHSTLLNGYFTKKEKFYQHLLTSCCSKPVNISSVKQQRRYFEECW